MTDTPLEIRRLSPNLSAAERKAAVFERMYRDDFSPEEMERINASFIAFYQRQKT